MINSIAVHSAGTARRVCLLLLITFILLAGGHGGASSRPQFPSSDEQKSRITIRRELEEEAARLTRSESASASFNALREKVLQYGVIPVIVRVRAPFRPESLLKNDLEIEVQHELITIAQLEILDRIYGYDPASVKRYESLPYLGLRVNSIGLELLNQSAMVIDIQDDRISKPSLSRSVEQIGGTAAWARGYTGLGQTIAIIDTGIARNHPFLAGKVIAEACYSTNFPGYGATSLCPGGARTSTAINSGLPCNIEDAGCDHGTHVAGIAAGRGNEFSGVAPDAWLISIQVFTRFEGDDNCGPGIKECIGAFDSDLLKAMEQVYQLRNFHSIAAVNLSLGSGRYTSVCDNSAPAMKDAIDLLRVAGVATIAAAGNERYTSAINAPACISSAISVASTSTVSVGSVSPVATTGPASPSGEQVSAFSNSSALIRLLAPGDSIKSSIPDGDFKSLSGTSMAAPHVAGAWALARQLSPNASVTTISDALAMNGVRILDPRNKIIKPRIQVDAALSYLETATPPNPVPEPPSYLTATANSTSQITLKWQDNSDNETGFRIRRRMDSLADWSIIATVGQGVTSFRHSGLRAGMSYQYSIVAFNGAGESGPSNEVTGATPASGPASPSSLSATVISDSEILLTWDDNSNDESGFRIRRRRGVEGAWSILTTVGANTNSARISGLNTGMMYYFTVSAINQLGESAASNKASAMTKEEPPASPTGLRAIVMSTSQISLRWQDNSRDELGFNLRRRIGSTGEWRVIATLGPDTTAFDDEGVPPGTTCHYLVTAFNISGESNPSNEAVGTTLTSDGVSTPATPSELIAMADTNSDIELQWSDNSGNENGFQIWERTGSAGEWKLAAMVGPGTTRLARSGLVAGLTYYYFVKAYNGAGESGRSNETSLTIPKMEFQPLVNGQTASGTVSRSGGLYYRIFTPPGTRQLTVETSGDGNVDLYVRHENQPNRSNFNCRSNDRGSIERCVINAPLSGNWHVMVMGNFPLNSNFKVTASYGKR